MPLKTRNRRPAEGRWSRQAPHPKDDAWARNRRPARPLGRTAARIPILLLVLVASACATSSTKPDLERLYRSWASREEGRRPVVVIHGLMGSQLVDAGTGDLVWGGMGGVLGGNVGSRVALPLEGETAKAPLVADGFIESIAGVDIYGSILRTLEEQGGYLMAASQEPPFRRATCFPFFYDWRLDNASNAALLGERLAEIRSLYGDPELKVDIVAHSMGGLIARYYILYGGRYVLDDINPTPDFAGARSVERLILLGTPNLGSVFAFEACILGDRIGLTKVPPEALATMPSMYQLMPSPDVPVLFLPDGSPAPLDIYGLGAWQEQGWGIFDPAHEKGMEKRFFKLHPNVGEREYLIHRERLRGHFGLELKRAAAFHRALAVAPVPRSVQTTLLGGDCTPTLRALMVEQESGQLQVRFKPRDVRNPPVGGDLDTLYFEPGDGTVTKSSLLGAVPAGPAGMATTALPDAHAVFICEEHRALVHNPTFQDNLLHVLLYQPITAAEACGL